MGKQPYETILDKYITMDWPMGIPYVSIWKAMQEYSDLQTSPLHQKIKELNDVLELAEVEINALNRRLGFTTSNVLITIQNTLNKKP